VRYRVNGREFKSAALKDKPGLVVDPGSLSGRSALSDLHRSRRQAFFICATMLNHFVIPPVADEFERRPDVIRKREMESRELGSE
jgi:hypothetical protein